MHILAPRGRRVRPTTERVREAIFNRVGALLWDRGGLDGKKVLDIFSGTGALGIEALSRGAGSVVFVEKDPSVFRLLQKNLERLKVQECAICLRGDVLKDREIWGHLRGLGPFDVILADPPYARRLTEFTVDKVLSHGLLAEGGILVVEEGEEKGIKMDSPYQGPSVLREMDPRVYGTTRVRMWERPG